MRPRNQSRRHVVGAEGHAVNALVLPAADGGERVDVVAQPLGVDA
jgi:hypothetical protein